MRFPRTNGSEQKKKKKRIFVTTNIGSVLSKLESNSIHHSISPIGVSRHSCRELSRVRVRKGREILLSIFFFKARVPSNRNESRMQVIFTKRLAKEFNKCKYIHQNGIIKQLSSALVSFKPFPCMRVRSNHCLL